MWDQKPNIKNWNSSEPSICLPNHVWTNFLKSFPVHDVNRIGRKFWMLLCFAGFPMNIMLAFFHLRKTVPGLPTLSLKSLLVLLMCRESSCESLLSLFEPYLGRCSLFMTVPLNITVPPLCGCRVCQFWCLCISAILRPNVMSCVKESPLEVFYESRVCSLEPIACLLQSDVHYNFVFVSSIKPLKIAPVISFFCVCVEGALQRVTELKPVANS